MSFFKSCLETFEFGSGSFSVHTLISMGLALTEQKAESIEFNIGSGMDDATRAEIWVNRSKYLGAVAKFKCFPIGAKDAPRFPVFLGFRDLSDF